MSVGTAVAVIDSGADLDSVKARLFLVREWIGTLDSSEEAAHAVKVVGEYREWMRIKKVAADMRVEALRIECVAIRRVGVLGGSRYLVPGNLRRVATEMAEMTATEFDKWLDRITVDSGPITPYGLWQQQREKAQRALDYARGEAYGRGEAERALGPVRPRRRRIDGEYLREYGTYDPDDIRDAIGVVLGSAIQDGAPFTMSDAVDNVCRQLGDSIPEPLSDNLEFRRGLAESIRYAIAADAQGVGKTVNSPRYVTFSDDAEGWLRVPWEAAHLDQLRNMCELRQRQAKEMAEAAARLQALHDVLAKAHAAHPDVTRLIHLASLIEDDWDQETYYEGHSFFRDDEGDDA
jgi:hypothetical protein